MATEWEDILVKHGIIEARDIPRAPTAAEYDAAAAQVRDDLHDLGKAALENAELDTIDELLEDEDESDILETIRKRRIAEMQALAAKNKFGELIHINETEYKKEVSEADPELFVVVFLFKPSMPACQLMEKHLRTVAAKFAAVKFVKIRSEEAIANYPDRNLPTVLVYKSSQPLVNWIGLSPFGGEAMTADDLEWNLAQLGAVKTQLSENPAIVRGRRQTKVNYGYKLRGRGSESDSDDE
eukprot:TRINITY_DN26669_c0_g1_i1.p1 TRINITY_DN26669_c0_g1~~TRINITY_DN26669_c0_g1_i1.p1  ORF type:complete len:240 (+),score=79.37 TRINITY_DN26669_c0_g1_i1:142-861(+)